MFQVGNERKINVEGPTLSRDNGTSAHIIKDPEFLNSRRVQA
jgi:hypothetical protein